MPASASRTREMCESLRKTATALMRCSARRCDQPMSDISSPVVVVVVIVVV